MVNIFIANLDWGITSEDLKTTFSAFGSVHYAHVVYDKETKKSKGYGYVEMESAEQAINAIEALNGLEVNGRKLDVKIASPKGNRPQKKEQVPGKKSPNFRKPYSNDNRRRSDQGHGRMDDNKSGGQFRGGAQGGGSFDKPNRD